MNRRNFLKWSGLAALAALAGGVTARSAMAGNKYYSGPVSDHFDGELFFNPDGEEPSGLLNLVRWKLGNGNKAWPDSFPSPFPQVVPEERITGDRMVATLVG